MNTMSALVIAASFFGSWEPPQKIIESQFWTGILTENGAIDTRPVLLTPRNLEKACKDTVQGTKATYLPVKEGDFELFCKLPLVKKMSENEVYFLFSWKEDSGLVLLAVYQAGEGQKRRRVDDETATSILNTLRDKLLDERAITAPSEGHDAFSPSFRWCNGSNDRNCASED